MQNSLQETEQKSYESGSNYVPQLLLSGFEQLFALKYQKELEKQSLQ